MLLESANPVDRESARDDDLHVAEALGVERVTDLADEPLVDAARVEVAHLVPERAVDQVTGRVEPDSPKPWPERAGETPWKDGNAKEVRRVDYEQFGLVTAAPGGARWYHQHFSVSKDPFRLTAWFGPHNPGRDPGPPGEKAIDYTGMDIPEGGTSIPYWMEDPYIRTEYQETLAKVGVQSRMKPEFYQVPEQWKSYIDANYVAFGLAKK